MTQEQHICDYLYKNKTITQLIAWSEFGVWRLASRISSLRSKGYPIKSTLKKAANGSRYALYTLEQR